MTNFLDFGLKMGGDATFCPFRDWWWTMTVDLPRQADPLVLYVPIRTVEPLAAY